MARPRAADGPSANAFDKPHSEQHGCARDNSCGYFDISALDLFRHKRGRSWRDLRSTAESALPDRRRNTTRLLHLRRTGDAVPLYLLRTGGRDQAVFQAVRGARGTHRDIYSAKLPGGSLGKWQDGERWWHGLNHRRERDFEHSVRPRRRGADFERTKRDIHAG